MDQERIIFIHEYLSRYTDDTHYVSIRQIQNHLAEVSTLTTTADATIRRDLDRLTNMGNNIVKVNRNHNQAFYALIGKGFSFNEIRFIVDSISINKFLTAKKKRELIRKFEGMCSNAELRQLISRVTLNEKCSPSLDLLNNLETIHNLISERRRIDFEYGKYDTNKQIKYYKKKRELLPVRVIFFNNRFYLRCFNEENDKWRTYRVDRMKNIIGGEVSDAHLPKEEKYEGFVTDMFAPDYFDSVTLRVKKYLLDEMMEHFGEYASVTPFREDCSWVKITVRVGINRQFYRWLMQYSDGIELLAPAQVRADFITEVRNMMSNYGIQLTVPSPSITNQ